MNVLFWLSGSFDRRGPSEHLLADMIEALYRRGHTVHVLQKHTHGPQAPLPERLRSLGVQTTRIKCILPHKDNLAGRFAADIRYALQCAGWLKRHREFDRIFVQSSNVAGIQTRILQRAHRDIPVVYNVQDIFPENAMYSGKLKRGGAAYRWFSAMQRHAYRSASKIITISEDMREQLVAIGVPKEKIDIVYNWSYRDTAYEPAEIDDRCLDDVMDRACFNVVYAGNIGMMQNVEVIIRAAAQMKGDRDIRFRVIGDGMYRQKLEALAAELQAENVSFHDMMQAECAPAIYSAADVNVIPLAKGIYRTALPSKTATCLACGKPIVFMIGQESKFAMNLRARTGCMVLDSDGVDALCDTLRSIRRNGIEYFARHVFETDFSRTKNSDAYASIIENA